MVKRRRLLLLPVLLIALCCGFLVFLLTRGPLDVGTAAPVFTFPSVTSEAISLADFEGRPILLNFWSPI